MALPTPGWNVVFGEIPAASKWTQLGQNDDALAAGTGFNTGAIPGTALANAGVTSSKLSLDYVEAFWATTDFITTAAGFVNTGLNLTLAAIGTWLISGEVRISTPAIASSYATVDLYNQTGSAVLPNSARLSFFSTGADQKIATVPVGGRIVTTVANTVVGLRLKPDASGHSVALQGDLNGYSSIRAIRVG